ncbi:pilus assembly protein PilN [Arenicella chitinivorans]|uniref:Pilus assembly protein PilN n=1 Tax=Arenicella chitinivorans TaxID=1329800 RepID=A0A918S4I7_9GAMM|nr:PilN domain-containing protein [Arenicella chitinivorans]GHA20018.1 pilus assembly protein PilN [Arenicella chitinivorans]
MANINLLPWREAQRRERNRATLAICIAMWVAAGLVVLAGKLIMDARISNQETRNAYLQSEINALSKVIKEIEDLKTKRDALLARMQVIQNLQQNRSQIVHMFDDLVTKLPKGVYYNRIAKSNNRLDIDGYAQSNERVSALMRNLDSSDWFDQSSLKQVDVVDQNGLLVSQFKIDVKEQSPNRSNDGAEDIR